MWMVDWARLSLYRKRMLAKLLEVRSQVFSDVIYGYAGVAQLGRAAVF